MIAGRTDATFGYRCYTSVEASYIVQCLMGKVEGFDRLPWGRTLSAVAGRAAEPGRPPRGGVENLVFTQNEDGRRNMNQSYQGQDCYIRYAPSGNEDQQY